MQFSIVTKKNFWLIFPFLEPLVFKSWMQPIDTLYSIAKIIALFFILIDCINVKKLPKMIWLIILYQLVLYVSTLTNPHGDVMRLVGPSISVIGPCLYVQNMFEKNKWKEMLYYISAILSVLCIINLITVLVYPNGIVKEAMDSDGNEQFFLGIENRFSFFYLPLLGIQAIYSLAKKRKIGQYVWIMGLINTLVLVNFWAVGGMLAMALLMIFLLCFNMVNFGKLLKVYLMSIVILLGNYLLIIERIMNKFEHFFTITLDKDVTMSGRTFLWDYGLLSFSEHPFLGVGYVDIGYLGRFLDVAHMHNLLMNILFTSGLIGIFLFFAIQYQWMKKVDKFRNTKEGGILIIIMFVSFFMSMADSFDGATFWIIVMLAYNINKIIDGYECKNKCSYGNV